MVLSKHLTPNLFKPEGQYDKICIAGPAPSLTKEQCRLTMRPDVFNIVIGDAYRYNRFADIMYHCDAAWWNHYDGVPEFMGCQRVSYENTGRKEIKHLMGVSPDKGLTLKESCVVTGRNSGYQAINLAAHYRPKKIFLIGYDMKDSSEGKHNIIGDHPIEIKRQSNFATFIKIMRDIVKPLENLGITVYNCSIDSDLDCFEKRDLKDVIDN